MSYRIKFIFTKKSYFSDNRLMDNHFNFWDRNIYTRIKL
uniref:Uncharacterized protein n=1 Tax=Siphoviridae sp. ct2D011 TaxID=2825314 RepID=A0A8S5V969_9CAUD|nr:MAG TPA: hypothetical protein [Siphoviridae sp. ct2D011]